MGRGHLRPAPPAIDINEINRAHQAAMAHREESLRAQLEKMDARYQQQLQSMIATTAEDRQRSETQFQRERDLIIAGVEAEKIRYESRIDSLAQSMQAAEQRVADLASELDKPIKDRQAKIDFVNGLNLTIHQNKSLLLVGPKGMGKSTFLWLLNKGEMPKKSLSDGTKEIIKLEGFVDSIGLRGWSPEELLKLLVLLIYDGIPKDLIIFGNDRIDLPVTSLGLLGINNAMIVIMSSEFWNNFAPPAGRKKLIHLVESNDGVRVVHPEEDLNMVYNLPVYDDIMEFGLGTPITHHENIEGLVERRAENGISPFKHLLETLGNQFSVNMQNNNNIEMLFRFIYVYEKKYNKDRLKFMNSASLQDF